MQLRWGSCTAKGNIILNPELIKAPHACIEYVIIHELYHLVNRNHTKAFFALQSREMPDWEKWMYLCLYEFEFKNDENDKMEYRSKK